MSDKPAAVVTGGRRGIGKAISMELASLGYDLAVSHVSGMDSREKSVLEKEYEALGVACELMKSDISDAYDRQELVNKTRARFGRCDILVNNAGVAPLERADLLETTAESYDRVMNTNLKGPFFLTQLVAAWMIEQKKRNPERIFRIINIGSISAYTSSTSRGEYCLSKAGMAMMTMLFADRLAEYGIGVFEIRPGIIATDMTAAVKQEYDALMDAGLTPIRRWGEAADVAKAVHAIVSGKLDFSTGQVLDVDGGFHLRRL